MRINKNHSEKEGIRTYLLKGKLFCDCQPDLRNFKWYYNNKKKLEITDVLCLIKERLQVIDCIKIVYHD